VWLAARAALAIGVQVLSRGFSFKLFVETDSDFSALAGSHK
jgi:hypothetical protein